LRLGTVPFRDGSIVIGTGTLAAGKASVFTASLLGGSHSITAAYSGDPSFKSSSTTAALAELINFTSTITTKVSSLTVNAGQAVSITSTGSVTGSVVVNAGGALSVSSGQVLGKLTSTGATAIALCGGTFKNLITINSTSGLLLIGGSVDGPIPGYCAANSVNASLSLDGNLGQVEVDANTFSGSVSLTNTNAPLASEIEGNTIKTNLSCSTNSPAPGQRRL
jgi:Bacterial Ig-like domain (group 3)